MTGKSTVTVLKSTEITSFHSTPSKERQGGAQTQKAPDKGQQGFSLLVTTVLSLFKYDKFSDALFYQWKVEKTLDKFLQLVFISVFLVVFAIQLYHMINIIYLVGRGEFLLTDEQFTAFFVSVFVEITVVLSVMVKYLFSEKQHIDENHLIGYKNEDIKNTMALAEKVSEQEKQK